MSVLSRRVFLRSALAGSSGLILAACQPKVVEKIIKETVVVEKEKIVKETIVVKEAVEVSKEVTRVVEKIVEKEPASKPPVTIRIHTNQGDQWYGWWNKAWQSNVSGWRSEHPNITLQFELTADALQAAIMTHWAAGTLGDIVWQGSTHRSHMAFPLEYKIVRDLMPMVEASSYDLKQFYPGIVKGSSWEGAFYFMPHTSEPRCPVIAYNRDMVAKMGAPEPQNDWDYMQLTEWGQSLTKDGVYGFHVGHMIGDSASTSPQYRQFGCEQVSADGKVALPEASDMEGLVNCLQWRHDLIYKYQTHPAPSPEFNVADMFIAEKVASFIIWPVWIGTLAVRAGDKFRVGFFYTPLDKQGSKRRSSPSEHMHGVTTVSKNPQEAFEVLMFHSSLEFAVQGMVAGMGATIGRPDFFADPRVLKVLPGAAMLEPIMAQIEPDFFCANYRGHELRREWGAVYDLVMLNKQGVTEGAEAIKKACQDVLDRPVA